MAYSCRSHLLVTIFIAASYFIAMSTVTARPLSSKPSTLAARLKLGDGDGDGGEDQGGSTKCWDSLFELQSCTGEVILFFLNGDTYLGPSCCNAIRNIEHQCWPSMLGSLGFTPQEGDILLGFCDRSISGSHSPTPPKVSNATATTRMSQGMHA